MKKLVLIIFMALLFINNNVLHADVLDFIASGDAAFAQKDLVKATQFYQIALRYEPGSTKAKTGLAKCYFRKGQRTRVEKIIHDVLLQEPNNTEALYLRGKLYLADNENSLAIQDFEAIIQKEPTRLEFYHHLIRALHGESRSDEIDAVYDKLRNLTDISQ